jgi:nucleoside-diphosphate-sugar epimerase
VLNTEEVIINGDGEQTRDLLYVADAVQGVTKAMDSNVNNADVFLIATNTETSVNQVLKHVQEISGRKVKVKKTEPLKGDIRRMKYDYSKARDMLDFKPSYSVREGIKRLIEYSATKKTR